MRTLRTLAVAALAAAFVAAPAVAEFSNSEMNTFVSMLNAKEGLTAAEQKAVDQINATADKEYNSYAQELVAYAKVVTFADKAFPSDEGVQATIAALCEGSGVGSPFFDLLSETLPAQAQIGANNADPVKAGKLVYNWITKWVIAANAETDCAKRLKLWSKAAKGAEKALKKWPQAN